jgi:hypothetical protein
MRSSQTVKVTISDMQTLLQCYFKRQKEVMKHTDISSSFQKKTSTLLGSPLLKGFCVAQRLGLFGFVLLLLFPRKHNYFI